MSKLDKALDKYYQRFQKKYPLCIADTRTTEEIIEEIEFCVDSGNEAEDPIYEIDADY